MTTTARFQPAVAKIYVRLLAILMIAYFLNALDRTNLGMAAPTFKADVGISAAAYGLGAGLFFLTYAALEIPSNLLLRTVGARIWLFRIMVTWGILAAAMALVWNEWSFYAVRLLFGAAEAGFYPGCLYLITQWFPQAERPKAIGVLVASAIAANVLGSPIGGLLLQMQGVGGLHGWQWLFLIEGLAAVAFAFVLLALLRNKPTEARWLDPIVARDLEGVIAAENASSAEHAGIRSSWGVARDPQILLLIVVYFVAQVVTWSVTYFLPTILTSMGDFTPFVVGLMNAVPFVFGVIGVLTIPRLASRYGSLLGWLIVCALGMTAGVLIAAFTPGWTAFAGFCVIGVFMFAPTPLVFSYAGYRLDGVRLAVGLALISSLGILGGFFGPTIIGFAQQLFDDANAGWIAVGALCVIAALAASAVRWVGRQAPPRPATAQPAPSVAQSSETTSQAAD